MDRGYVFDNAWHEAKQRLELLESFGDPATIRHLEALGILPAGAAWRLGPGAGSIALWLSQRVGPAGSVVATDLDTRFLEPLSQPNLEIRRHDIAAEELPDVEFDLVHRPGGPHPPA
jgi:Dimethyladenosine transferase (rRNA methylation)